MVTVELNRLRNKYMTEDAQNSVEQRLAAARIFSEEFEIPGEGVVDEKRFLNWLRRLKKPIGHIVDKVVTYPETIPEQDELHGIYANLGFIPDGDHEHLTLEKVSDKMVSCLIGWNYDKRTGDPSQYEFDSIMSVVTLKADKESMFKSGVYKLDRRDWEYDDLIGMVGKKVNIRKFMNKSGKGRIVKITLDKV